MPDHLIYLTRGYVAKVSREDADLVFGYRWQSSVRLSRLDGQVVGERVYARRTASAAERASLGRSTVYLHQQVAGFPANMVVDHINGNGLDCTRPNLRVASYQENTSNRIGIALGLAGRRGVIVEKRKHGVKYRARFGEVYLGMFTTADEAAAAYDRHLVAQFGQFATTNFPIENYLKPDKKKNRPRLVMQPKTIALEEPPF